MMCGARQNAFPLFKERYPPFILMIFRPSDDVMLMGQSCYALASHTYLSALSLSLSLGFNGPSSLGREEFVFLITWNWR
jgi:hypothetical protein